MKSYYYWLSKIRKPALEELPRKKNGMHMCTDQTSGLLTESSSGFAEFSLPDRNISRSDPAAILHIRSITAELYEGTSARMLENWLFSGNPNGAEASAEIYTLEETAKANGPASMKYIQYILSDMPGSAFFEHPEYLSNHP